VKPLLALLVSAALLLAGIGCGAESSTSTGAKGPAISHSDAQAQRQAAKRRAARRHRAQVRAHRAAIRRAHRAAVRQRHAEAAQAHRQEMAEAREREEEESECDPNYAGACLDPYSSDYDCEGGSGDGPDYTGEVVVVGEDHYDLDLEEDGLGCEP
jgi:hypothetical protein